MIIGTIVNGVVIDHIPAGRGLELYRYLGLDELDCEVAHIRYAKSAKYGRKDILKINETIGLDFDILGYMAPQITVNIIKNGVRVEKIHPALPAILRNVVACKNPRCVTSSERALQSELRLTDRENAVYRCVYCDTKAERPRIFPQT